MLHIEVSTYEDMRIEFFEKLLDKSRKKYGRLYRRFKESPYLFEGTVILSDAGAEVQYLEDVVKMLQKGANNEQAD